MKFSLCLFSIFFLFRNIKIDSFYCYCSPNKNQNGHLEVVEFLLKNGADARLNLRCYKNPFPVVCGVCI